MPRGKTQTTLDREAAIFDWADQQKPVTVRQLFYRLSTLDLVPKTDAGYKAIGRICTKMREAGDLPYTWLVDNTRWQRKPKTYSSLEDALQLTAETYRKSLWINQDAAAEVWCEKEALAGVIYPVTSQFDVPLMVAKGYASLSFLYSAAEEIKDKEFAGKKVHIYYLHDFDPDGVKAAEAAEARLREFSQSDDFVFNPIALNAEQVRAMDLPTRPTKRTTRSKGFSEQSCELDAIPPSTLRQMVEGAIVEIIDPREWERLQDIERFERESIPHLIRYVSQYTDTIL